MVWEKLPSKEEAKSTFKEILKDPERIKNIVISVVLAIVGFLLILKIIPIIGRII